MNNINITLLHLVIIHSICNLDCSYISINCKLHERKEVILIINLFCNIIFNDSIRIVSLRIFFFHQLNWRFESGECYRISKTVFRRRKSTSFAHIVSDISQPRNWGTPLKFNDCRATLAVRYDFWHNTEKEGVGSFEERKEVDFQFRRIVRVLDRMIPICYPFIVTLL